MSISGLRPDASEWRRRLADPAPSHESVVDERIDFTTIDPLVLGDVWSVAEAIDRQERFSQKRSMGGVTAEAIIALRSANVPAFSGPACRDYLDLLSDQAETAETADRHESSGRRQRACFAVARCVDLSFEGLRPSAGRYLEADVHTSMPHFALALGRIVGGSIETAMLDRLASELAASPLLIKELHFSTSLGLPDAFAFAEVASRELERTEPVIPKPRYRLSDMPLYPPFAEQMLRHALERVRAVHDVERPYIADKAFTPAEAKVIGRAMRVGLDRDEAWVEPILSELFLKASVAPTSARTMPSQAVSIALGQAIEDYPTPEAIVVLRQVLRAIRHAGVEKKLQRSLREAERGLAGRIHVALRLPREPATKPQLTTFARTLEAALGAAVTLPFENWHTHLIVHPQAIDLAGKLVWRMNDRDGRSFAVLPIVDRGGTRLEDQHGRAVDADPLCRVRLWHPLDVTTVEREAWRDRVMALKIRQPFKQVFREHYAVPITDGSQGRTGMFSGHAISLRPFLGLARQEGWRIVDRHAIARPVGKATITMIVSDEIDPGAAGWTTTGAVEVWAIGDPTWVPARFDDLPALALSETLRSLDLLISTSGFAIEPEGRSAAEDGRRQARLERLGSGPLGPMADMRRQAIRRALAGRPDMERLQFDARHLRLGAYAIHLATGRITRDGDPVTIKTAKRSAIAAVPWLPYDERLLELIVYTAVEIAGIERTGFPGGSDV